MTTLRTEGWKKEEDCRTRMDAEAGDACNQFFTAKLCFQSDNTDGGEQVLRWLTMSAEGGYAWGLEALASICLDGKIAYPNGKAKWSAPKDTVRAAVYLERLVEYGWSDLWIAKNPNALWRLRSAPETLLARMYLSGEGVAKDVRHGLWLHHLATIGLDYAEVSMKELGTMYLHGAEGVTKDAQKAAYWMLKYDIRSDRPTCYAEYLREYFLRESDDSELVLGHSQIREVRSQDPEAFMRGLDIYLNDEVERKWLLWSRSKHDYNDWYHRGNAPEGSYVLAEPNPYRTMRKDRVKAEKYIASLWNGGGID